MSDFHRNRFKKDGLQGHCRACRVRINRLSHARNKETLRRYKRRIRLRNQLLVLAYLWQHPCVDCGERDPVVLDFDHWGKKRAAIASMVRWQTSWKAIAKEISRCDVRCANCHRRATARERGWLKARLQAAGYGPQASGKKQKAKVGGALAPLVGLDAVLAVVEQLFVPRQDEEHAQWAVASRAPSAAARPPFQSQPSSHFPT